MTVKDDIYTFLSSESSVTNLVPAGQIGWIDCDPDTDYPRIVYQNISSPSLYQSNDEWQRWRFYIFSSSAEEILQISEALKDVLNRLQDTIDGTFYNIFLIDEIEIERQQNIYVKYQDYRIIYTRS